MSWLTKLTSSMAFALISYLAVYVTLKMNAFYKNFEYWRLISIAEPDIAIGIFKSLLQTLQVLHYMQIEREYHSHFFLYFYAYRYPSTFH